MEENVEKDSANLDGIFQQIINDLKNGTPLWEDFISKATKLQTCLRATIQAITTYLDAFQKIADAATNTRGATKEIGTALTRICLRHRAVEMKMKTFTSTIMDCLVAPLQEKLEDWKKNVVNLDKDHAKEYKKARSELKKRSMDTLRLQKKVRKSGKADDLQKALMEVTEKKNSIEETEKRAVREALIEERRRYCLFVTFLKPVVDEEISMLSELSHLQEALDQLEKHTVDPSSLPPASEQVLVDLKGTDASWSFQSPTPSSPSSIGSRKSSMSSSSGSSKSNRSPNHMFWNSSPSQQQVSDRMDETISSATQSTISLALPPSTWPNLQDTLQFEKAATAIINDRPHTISSAYEKGHQRPVLSVYTFQMPDSCHSHPCSPLSVSSCGDTTPVVSPQAVYAFSAADCSTVMTSNNAISERPPLPQRNSSLVRPNFPDERMTQPTYVNMYELASMAAFKAQELHFNLPPPQPHENTMLNESSNFHNEKQNENVEKESSTSESSLESSSGYGSQTGISGVTPISEFDNTQQEDRYGTKNSNQYLNEALHFVVEPRTRLSSASSAYCTIKSGTLSRRGSVHTPKPFPPVRRTTSIVSSSRSSVPRNSPIGSMENLPPPPAFLLENTTRSSSASSHRGSPTPEMQKNVANIIAVDLQNQQLSMSTLAEQLKSETAHRIYATTLGQHRRSIETMYAPPTSMTSSATSNEQKSDKQIEIEKSSGVSVAETVRTLTEMNHQPASPVSVRRAPVTRSTSTDRRPECDLISALSARIAPNLSPCSSRKHYQEMVKLRVPRACRVRQWITLRTVTDPTICRVSLMDQIKKGTHLRPTSVINDRSAPKIG